MTKETKKIVSVVILHLDELGYGPEGKHSRESWRDECLRNLLAGKVQFEAWQESWLLLAKANQRTASFSRKVTYFDGSVETLDLISGISHCLDFVKQNFEKLDCENFVFLYPTIFSNAEFSECAFFTRTTFLDFVNFGMTKFLGIADFGCVEFKKDSYFSKAHFFDTARFDCVKFLDTAEFDSVSFSGEVTFSKAHFFKKANFQLAQFENSSLFANTNFNQMAVFTNTEFRMQSIFLNAEFRDHSDFENVIFNNVGHFEGAYFLQLFPAFRGCKIDSTRLEFYDDSHFPQDDFSEDAIKNISFLKRLSDEHGQKDQALHFNAMELRARRKSLCESLKPHSHQDAELLKSHMNWRVWVRFSNFFRDDFWFCVFTWLYEKVSDFGRSFMRPLVLLVCLMVISYLFGIFSAIKHSPAKDTHARQAVFTELATEYPFKNQCDMIPLSAYRAATEYSLYRSGNFLNFTDNDNNTKSVNMRLFGEEIEPCWARMFGFVKGIFTAILLFLIALGLRNKYRVS
jgi:hypothetical protein